jgi:hypothetical protein
MSATLRLSIDPICNDGGDMKVNHREATGSTTLEETYPAVPLAYEFVWPSYEFAARRLESVETRIRALLTLWATVTFLAPVFIASAHGKEETSFRSVWFVLAMVVAAVALAIATHAHARGSIKLLSPALLQEKSLHWRDWEFKRNVLYWASVAFEANVQLVDDKGRAANAASVCLLIEIALLAVWPFRPAWPAI